MIKKYAIVGAGSRGLESYAEPLTTEFQDCAKLVGVYDINPVRAEYLSNQCGNVPVFHDFNEMLEKGKPDVVIVTTVDKFHHEYIIKTLEAGSDVISEKPMTIDPEKCRAVLEAEKRTGRKVTVTFNMRYMPYMARVKEVIREGAAGKILGIDFEWFLDTSHGASYFRRWHRYLDKSGGLLVHKATHHFDIINWWLEEEPEEVFAFGSRRFYGPTRKERGEYCRACRHQKTCEFYWDIATKESRMEMYVSGEHVDGYIRDRCVFAEDIDIYDAMSVTTRYSKGALLSYSLVAFSPYEGWRASVNGTEGRLEIGEFNSGPRSREPVEYIYLHNRKGECITYPVNRSDGSHGGSDDKLRKTLFAGGVDDPLGQQADSWAGAMSLMIGACANISIQEKRPVFVKELLNGCR